MQLTDSFGERAAEGARQLLGVRFRHQGRNEGGVDCIGLILWAYRHAGWRAKDNSSALFDGYERIPTGPELDEALCEECEEVPLSLLRQGDTVSMAWEDYASGLPCHLALVSKIENGVMWIIHTHWKTRVVSEHPVDTAWRERMCKGYRPRGMN